MRTLKLPLEKPPSYPSHVRRKAAINLVALTIAARKIALLTQTSSDSAMQQLVSEALNSLNEMPPSEQYEMSQKALSA